MGEVLLSHNPPSLRLILFILLIRAAGRAPHDDIFLLRSWNMLRLQEVELDEGVDDEKSGPQDPPESNVARQWFGHRLLPELDADDELSHDDGDQDPGLPAQLVTLRVVQQLESLSQT